MSGVSKSCPKRVVTRSSSANAKPGGLPNISKTGLGTRYRPTPVADGCPERAVTAGSVLMPRNGYHYGYYEDPDR